MKTIKFVCADINQKHFTTAVRNNVNDYFRINGISTKGNLRTAIQTIVMISAYVAPFILILTLQMQGWLALIFAAFMGTAMAGIGMCVMHDAAHGSLSHKNWVNKLFSSTIYLLGSNVFTWKIQHNVLHHAYTNIEGYDHDIASRGPIRLSQHAPLKRIHYYQHINAFFFYGLMTLMKIPKDFAQLAEYNKTGLTKKHHSNPILEFIKLLFIKFTYLATFIGLPLLFTEFTFWQVILGFVVMHWMAGCILATVFQMAHVVSGVEQSLPNEDGVIESEWFVHELKTTSDFARHNHFLNWYIGGLNFQIEHHLFPHICHVHYPKIAPIVEQTAIKYGYNYNLKPSLFAALSSHVSRLKELGRA